MRWGTYRSAGDDLPHAALVVDGCLYALEAEVQLIDLLGDGPDSLTDAAARAKSQPYEVVAAADARLLAPVPRPPSVRDFMAFENHYRDTREALGLQVEPLFYEQPCYYFQNPAAIVGPYEKIPMAPGTAAYDFELEVAAIIGRSARNVSVKDAGDHIAGYTMLCDWSARDLQATEGVFGNGPVKGKDTATSLGPYLVTPDELEPFRSENGFDLSMTAAVNGVQYSAGNWSTVFWSMPELLSYASRGTELRPGDVVGTGTVGTGSLLELQAVHGADAYPWLVPGDQIRLVVEQLGDIRGEIVPAAPVESLR